MAWMKASNKSAAEMGRWTSSQPWSQWWRRIWWSSWRFSLQMSSSAVIGGQAVGGKSFAVVLKGAGGVGAEWRRSILDGALTFGLKEGLYLGVKEGVEGGDFGAVLGDFDEGHSDGGPCPTRGGKHLRDVRCVLTSLFNKLVAGLRRSGRRWSRRALRGTSCVGSVCCR